MASFKPNNTLVLTTVPSHRGLDYEAYLGIIKDSLKELQPTGLRVNQRSTKFLLHNIPTAATPDDVRIQIEDNYPLLKLTETARWLTTPEKRINKVTSTMVIAFAGSITMEDLGNSSLLAINRSCNIEEYYQFSPTQQCHNCQLYGHPEQKCPSPTPTCGVCAEPHSTKAHPCSIPACKAGPACSHPPIRCASCNAPHKSSDANCPYRLKVQEIAKARWMAKRMPTTEGGIHA